MKNRGLESVKDDNKEAKMKLRFDLINEIISKLDEKI